ncbi:MAG: hypothetical protein IJV32_04965 [Bacteroidales bacterium]|nr:hypothetical protein [Bacteroidales bacterium]
MFSNILIALFAVLVTGISLMKRDLTAVVGAVWASGAGERWSVKVLVPVIIIVAAGASILPSCTPGDDYFSILPYVGAMDVATITVATLAAVLLTSFMDSTVAVPYIIMGAFFGYQFMAQDALDAVLALRIAGSWILAAVLCAVLSWLFTLAGIKLFNRKGRHLAIADRKVLHFCMLAAVLLALCFGWNEGAAVSVFPAMLLGDGFTVAAGVSVVVAILPLIAGRTLRQAVWRMADSDLDISSVQLLAVMLSMAAVFGVFSSSLPMFVGLRATPLSAIALLFAALAGSSVASGKAVVSGKKLGKSLLAVSAGPVIGFVISYCLGLIVEGSVYMAVSLVVVLVALYLYLVERRKKAMDLRLIASREEQIESAQKAISALEIRSQMNEMDLLNKLEIKRKELVDFAVGVSDQKTFMEGVYDSLDKISKMPDGPARKEALDQVLASLRERMYFTREMNDFYARSEVLNHDFNMRLADAYPNLTEAERKLANLLRQGFSSKYISSLMNITPKSVEISRYRLRTKLGLSRSDNLVKFIKSI